MFTDEEIAEFVQKIEWLSSIEGHDFETMFLGVLCRILAIIWSEDSENPTRRLEGELQTTLDRVMAVSTGSEYLALPLEQYIELVDELVGRGWMSDAATVCKVAARYRSDNNSPNAESLALDAFSALLTLITTGRFFQPLQVLQSILERTKSLYGASPAPRAPNLSHICVAYAYRLGFGYAIAFDIPLKCDRTATGVYSRFLNLIWDDLMQAPNVTDEIIRLKFRVAGCGLFLVNVPTESPYYPHIKHMSNDITIPLRLKPLPGNSIRGYQTRHPEALIKHYRAEGSRLGRHAARLTVWTDILTSSTPETYHGSERVLLKRLVMMLHCFRLFGQPQYSLLASEISTPLFSQFSLRQHLDVLNRAIAHATGNFLQVIEIDARHFIGSLNSGSGLEVMVIEGEKLFEQLKATDCGVLQSSVASGISHAYASLLPLEIMALPIPRDSPSPYVCWARQALDVCPADSPRARLDAWSGLLLALQDDMNDDSAYQEQLELVTRVVKDHSSQTRLRPRCIRIIHDFINSMAFRQSRPNYKGKHPIGAVAQALRLARDIWSQMSLSSQSENEELFETLTNRAEWYSQQSSGLPVTDLQRRVGRYDGDEDPLWQATRACCLKFPQSSFKQHVWFPLILYRSRDNPPGLSGNHKAGEGLSQDQSAALTEEVRILERQLAVCAASDFKPQWRVAMAQLASLYERLWIRSSAREDEDFYAHAALALLSRLEEDLTDLRIDLRAQNGGRGLKFVQRLSGQWLHTQIYRKVIVILICKYWRNEREAIQARTHAEQHTMLEDVAPLNLCHDDIWEWVQKSKARTIADAFPSASSDTANQDIVCGLDPKSQEYWSAHVAMRRELQEDSSLGVLYRVSLADAWRMHRRLMREWDPSLQILLDEEFGIPPTPGVLAGLSIYDISLQASSRDREIVYVDWFEALAGNYGLLTLKGQDQSCRESCLHSRGLGITESELADWLRRFWRGNRKAALRHQDQYSSLQDLNKLVAPLKYMTRPGDVLVLCPTGLLHQIPLHALLVDDGPLIERNPIVYTSSQNLAGKCLMAAGQLICAKTAWRRPPSVVSVYEKLASGITEPRFDPQVQQHVRINSQQQVDILNAYRDPDSACRHLWGEEATKARVIEALQSSPFVSYLGHSEVSPEGTDNLDQHLRLFDEPLRAEDILDLKIPRSVVLLQACSSSEQSIGRGDEPLGLVTACLLAGATSVIGNLWPVDVYPASAFSKSLIENLRDASVSGDDLIDLARVFQSTVLEHRELCNSTGSWASFVLHGSPVAPNWFVPSVSSEVKSE